MKKLLITLLILANTGLAVLAEAPNFYDPPTEAKLEYNIGIDYYKIGQYDNAMAAFRQAINIDPNYIDAYYNLGAILEYLKQDEAALAVFKQIIVRKPDDYESVFKAAYLSSKLGQADKAKTYLALIPKESVVYPKAQMLASTLKVNTPSTAATKPSTAATKPSTPATKPSTPASNANTAATATTNTAASAAKPVSPQAPKIEQTNGMYNNIPSPTGITSDKNGNVYVACFSDNLIYKITPDGKKIIFIKDAKINGPIGMVSDLNGNIYVSNYNSNNVIKITPAGAISVLISNVQKPYGVHIDGNLLFVSSQGSNSVLRYKL